jgi:hypothetical protein
MVVGELLTVEVGQLRWFEPLAALTLASAWRRFWWRGTEDYEDATGAIVADWRGCGAD